MTTIAVREMEQAVEEAEAVAAEAAIESSLFEAGPVCAHYWVIEPANSPVSREHASTAWKLGTSRTSSTLTTKTTNNPTLPSP